MNSPGLRVVIFIFMFVSVLVLPWWVSGFILFLLLIYTPSYWEIIFFGFLIDLLYSDTKTFFPTALTVSTASFLFVTYLKTLLRT